VAGLGPLSGRVILSRHGAMFTSGAVLNVEGTGVLAFAKEVARGCPASGSCGARGGRPKVAKPRPGLVLPVPRLELPALGVARPTPLKRPTAGLPWWPAWERSVKRLGEGRRPTATADSAEPQEPR
jgi:hypothetical protein